MDVQAGPSVSCTHTSYDTLQVIPFFREYRELLKPALDSVANKKESDHTAHYLPAVTQHTPNIKILGQIY